MVGENFRKSLKRKSDSSDSKIILALDVAEEDINTEDLESKYLEILDEVSEYVAGIKIGYPLVLKAGLGIISKISSDLDIPIIADFKIADVPHICKVIAKCAFKEGADAVISHGFVGPDSMEAVVAAAEEEGERGVIIVPNMSHPGGELFISNFTDRMLELASDVGATGVIGPATRPKEIVELRSQVGKNMLILTPGIGAQGALPGDAIKKGADYEIVGRSIYTAMDPAESAAKIRDKINRNLGDENR